MALRLLFVLCFSLLSLCNKAQYDAKVYKKLEKRYGSVFPWGKGYILKVMSLHGFADSAGHIQIPIQFVEFDTLLHDRAFIGPILIDEKGEQIARGSYGFRVVNRSKRLLSKKEENFRESLIDDTGRVLTADPFNSWLPKETMVRSKTGNFSNAKYGVITLSGETVLPAHYQSVMCGKNICAAFRSDTAFFFNRNGTLLFTIPKVHGSLVLENDIMAVRKFGLYALVNKRGALLTDFKLGELSNLFYSDSSLTIKNQSQLRIPIPVPGYAISEGSPNKYLIDSLGRVLSPEGGYNFSMNKNGWLIVANGHRIDLVDPQKQVVASAYAEYKEMNFLSDRYVLIQERTYDEEYRSRSYDMKAHKFVNLRLRQPEENYQEGRSWPPMHGIGMWNLNGLFTADSICINEARSTLVKKNGLWGVLSITGDTILPFVYDTSGSYPHQKFFVGHKHKVAYLDWEGNLSLPMGLPELPAKIHDSTAYLKNGSIYSFKGWQLKKIDKKTIPYPTDLKFHQGIAYLDGSTALKRGLYNRNFKKLADEPYEMYYSEPIVTRGGITAIRDSSKNKVTLIDSSGRKLIKWFNEPKHLILLDGLALAINDSGETDKLLVFKNGITKTKKIRLDAAIKKSALVAAARINQNTSAPREYRQRKSWTYPPFPWTFEDESGEGRIYNESVLQIEGAQSYETTKAGYIKVKIKGKCGLYTLNGSEMLAPMYDSISNDYYCWIYQNGKKGFLDINSGKTIPAIYDSIVRYSGGGGLIAGYKNGNAEFSDSSGHIISSGWHNASPKLYQLFNHTGFDYYGIPVIKNDSAYLLFPSAGDKLIAVPDRRVIKGMKIIEDYSDGKIILSRNDSSGVYEPYNSQWTIPLQPGSIEKQGNHFILKNYTIINNYQEYPTDISVYTSRGNLLFSMSGSFDGIKHVNFTQWKLWSYNSGFDGPVINTTGKIIVPAYFRALEVIPGKYLYQAITTENKIWYDTLGGILIPKVFGPMETVTVVDSFIIASQDNKALLLTKAGKIISDRKFENIIPCTYGLILTDSINKTVEIDKFGPIENPLPDENVPFFVVTESSSGKQGLIDQLGKILIPCSYDEIEPAMDATKLVAKKDEQWGYIDLKNKIFTKFLYTFKSD